MPSLLGLFGGCESVLVRKRNRSGEYRVSQHSVWFTEEQAEIALNETYLIAIDCLRKWE